MTVSLAICIEFYLSFIALISHYRMPGEGDHPMAIALQWLRKLMKKILAAEVPRRMIRRRHALRLEWLEDRIQPSYILSYLSYFNGSNNAAYSEGGLVEDSNGNLFGTAEGGASGVGSLFEWVKSSDTLVTLVSFQSSNGEYPDG